MNQPRRILAVVHVFLLVLLRLIKIILAKPFIKSIYLKSWFGALGNNLVQIAHVEYLSKELNLTTYVLNHPFLKMEQRYQLHGIPSDSSRNMGVLTSDLLLADLQNQIEPAARPQRALLGSFYYHYDIFPFTPSLVDYRSIFKTKILPTIPHLTDDSIGDETLVIHIRSGDVFHDNCPHPAYVQPPLNFYLKVIEEFNFKDIVVVTQEDFKNPCIHHLQQLIPEIRIQALTLLEDVSTLLSAKNLVTSFGTFALTMAFASDKIRRLYIPQFDIKKGFWRTALWPNIFKLMFISSNDRFQLDRLDFDIHPVKIRNYLPIGDWQNNQMQRELMINHAREHILLSKE